MPDSPNPTPAPPPNPTPPTETAALAPSRPPSSWWRSWLKLGPAIIVAAVVLGPGSIVNASRVGCRYGYDLLWVVVLAGLLMAAMTSAAMQIGVISGETPCDFLRRRVGRFAAWLVGGSLMIAIVLFQASNNHAIAMALEGSSIASEGSSAAIPSILVLNVAVMIFVISGRRNLYRWIERSMMLLVGVMLLAFLLTLVFVRPSLGEVASGLIPRFSLSLFSAGDSQGGGTAGGDVLDWMSVAALVATTFSVAAAFFQTYQVRERGWTIGDLQTGRRDAIVGIGTLAVMTAAIVMTAAGALHERVDASELTSAAAVAEQLRPLFGDAAAILFAVGILGGALSSFVVNAVIGGVVGSDAFVGQSSKDHGPNETPLPRRRADFSSTRARMLTLATLAVGMSISLLVQLSNFPLVHFIVVAQSLTVIGFPLLAVTLLWQWLGVRANLGIPEQIGVGGGMLCGLLVVLGLSLRTVVGLLGG
ncbi:MAG: Nramp family divalent metal transporter [Planctomycetota bacterium]